MTGEFGNAHIEQWHVGLCYVDNHTKQTIDIPKHYHLTSYNMHAFGTHRSFSSTVPGSRDSFI